MSNYSSVIVTWSCIEGKHTKSLNLTPAEYRRKYEDAINTCIDHHPRSAYIKQISWGCNLELGEEDHTMLCENVALLVINHFAPWEIWPEFEKHAPFMIEEELAIYYKDENMQGYDVVNPKIKDQTGYNRMTGERELVESHYSNHHGNEYEKRCPICVFHRPSPLVGLTERK